MPPGISDTHRLARLYNNIARAAQVYPSLGAGAAVVSAAADWTYGDYAVVIPEGAIAVPFDIQAVAIESCDKTAVFQLQLYKGATDEVIATIRFSILLGFYGNTRFRISGANIEASAQIRARIASSDGLANQATFTISASYILV